MANASANLQLALFSSGFVNPVLPHQIQKFAILMLMGINNKIPAGYAYFLTLTIAWVVFLIRHPVKVKAEANPFCPNLINTSVTNQTGA